MRINNNLSALTAFNSLNTVNNQLGKTIQQLSTGLRINSASDDAAGFAISEKMRSQISGLDRALQNSQDGISLLQTAEGALEQTNSMLQRMRELSLQASNDSLTSQDRQYIQLEIDQLKDQIDRIADTTQFNKKRILDGSSGALWASSDSSVKARINGGLTYTDEFGQKVSSEGNYRVEIKADPGQAQVQKSNIMLVKHKNVTMDRTVNHQAGIKDVSVNNVPAGNYKLTSEEATEARVVATCSYGLELDELSECISASVSQNNLRNNASILFEVTGVDENSGEIVLSAVSNVLKTDGTTETHKQENIRLSDSDGEFVDLSESLGLGDTGIETDKADGAFELHLQGGKAGDFSVGDKFVYNLNVAKDIEGTDRCVKIETRQNPSWPDGWQETMEIQTSNSFEQPEGAIQARILFVIDGSGSMGSAISNVATSLNKFIEKIANEKVDEVSVGIATYLLVYNSSSSSYNHVLTPRPIGGNDWITVDNSDPTAALSSIQSTLQSITVQIGSVDPYFGIGAAMDSYSLTKDNVKNYVVLVTDTGLEVPSGVTRSEVKQKLDDTDTTLITICPSSADYLFQSSNESDALTDSSWSVNYESSGSWGSTFREKISQQIGQETVKYALFDNLQLHDLPQMTGIFPDGASSPSQVITIHQGDESHDVTIEPTDTFATLNEKLNQYTGASTNAEVVQFDNGHKGIKVVTSILSGERITYTGNVKLLAQLGLRSNFDYKFSLDADKVTDKDIHFRNFFINKQTGNVHEGDIILSTSSAEMPEYDLLTSFEAAYVGQTPEHDVSLRDINNFWNSQGVFMLDQPKTITITQGNGRSASVTLYKTDTLEEVREKLNNAIGNDLGQLQYADRNNFVSYVREGSETPQTDESVAGTFVIRSVIPGKSGELSFSDDEEILKALGLNTIQESSETRYTASLYDAHSGKVISSGSKVTGNVINDALTGVDIEFDSMAGIKSSWDENSKRYVLSSGEKYTATIHLKDSGITFRTGANNGEDFSVQLGDMSSQALGISGVNATTRESASRSVGVIDRAINRVSSQRAKIGAYENALEHTMESLTVTSTNLISAESRIRDADMSKVMMNFVKLQILNQSGTSMLAQANQLPQSVLNILQQ